MPPILTTRRLTLAPLRLGDVGALRALVVDPDVRRWMCDGRVLPEAEVRALVQASLADERACGAGLFRLGRRDAAGPLDLVAGFAGLKSTPLGVELAAALAPRHQGAGLAAEACEAVLAHAFGPLDLPRVLACADAPNLRSQRLIERLGFRFLFTRPGAFGSIRWFARDRPGGAGRGGRGR